MTPKGIDSVCLAHRDSEGNAKRIMLIGSALLTAIFHLAEKDFFRNKNPQSEILASYSRSFCVSRMMLEKHVGTMRMDGKKWLSPWQINAKRQ